MPLPCLLWVVGSERLAVVAVKGGGVSGSVRALRGRRDLAQVLSPRYVNPTAAKRVGDDTETCRLQKERATERERDRERETGRLQPTVDGSAGSAKCQRCICVLLDASLEPAYPKSFTLTQLEKLYRQWTHRPERRTTMQSGWCLTCQKHFYSRVHLHIFWRLIRPQRWSQPEGMLQVWFQSLDVLRVPVWALQWLPPTVQEIGRSSMSTCPATRVRCVSNTSLWVELPHPRDINICFALCLVCVFLTIFDDTL